MGIKLALALNKIATGEYKTKLSQLALQRRNEDKAVTGFQAYYLLLVMFNVTLKGSVAYDFRHLTKVKCGGDRDLQGFVDRWDDVLNRLTTPIPDEQLEVMFWEQVQCCRDLEFIWTQYRFADLDSKVRSYRWLREKINSYLVRKRGDYNLRAQLRSVADQQPSAQSPRYTAPARQQSQSPRRRSMSRGRSGSKGSRKGSGRGTPKGGGGGNAPRRSV
eukprot:6467122-Amphidinium_carterae.1